VPFKPNFQSLFLRFLRVPCYCIGGYCQSMMSVCLFGVTLMRRGYRNLLNINVKIKFLCSCMLLTTRPRHVHDYQHIDIETKKCAPLPKIAKITKIFYLGGSRSFKVMNVDIPRIKLVSTACHDKQHVRAYLQLFSR